MLKSAIIDRNYAEGIEHYWVGEKKSEISKRLTGSPIPLVALIDTNCKVVYKGHPLDHDLEKDI